MKAVLLVGLGGFTGSVLRYLLGALLRSTFSTGSFPLGTFSVNILGSILIGVLFAMSARLNKDFLLMLTTGLCGGFTTFSTFSYENVNLIRGGSWSILGLYMGMSIILGILGVFSGVFIGQSIFRQ